VAVVRWASCEKSHSLSPIVARCGVTRTPAQAAMSNRFFKAIEEDDVETVEECLAKGLPGEGLNDFAADGYTPLHKACKVRGSLAQRSSGRFPAQVCG
jgi:hypothetical protein